MTNSATKLINQKLRQLTGTNKGTHSFRHSMATRLRDAGVPSDVRRAILGHAKGVSDKYGSWSLKVLRDALEKVVL